jgi:hypothetical protein
VQQYVANMRRLRDVVRGRGGRLMVVLQPEQGRLAGPPADPGGATPTDFGEGDRYWLHFPALYEQFVQRALAALAADDVVVLDGSPMLGDDRTAYLDPVHLSVSGHDRLARELAPHIDRLRRSS